MTLQYEHPKVGWKIQGFFKADAQKCYEEIGEDGATPESVLDKARDENSELHKCFEWNDGVAAEKYRLHQARKVIQMLVLVEEKKPEEEHREFTYVPRALETTSVRNEYRPRQFFKTNEDEYKILIYKAQGQCREFINRFAGIAELEDVRDAMKEFLAH